ncbi:MAG: NupC/NupG family nucleoside CNT transporter, partial [Candidatus Aminicenantes bacterium]|nr:NupC/NupG family nucleoside CNT transporter [Candidatus Aminicenantes bacterium]NIM81241.1 NupC/NupG family nucleoside CNT transporter [Candidatus Aminicenantes bacterium]NIN20616.1 NupC/NupG family nucleoside CNT transporter [Candidatus Aminicenantes bacterium]NIN44395.1 NupC/NupG family nucleoside CNT transporter [Candidatus Aminicenantes bacterium]NIN87214.1 NupC/NupG family nucleoside CNT transporter [Candidatus Aminicenantes bacterium]
MNVMTVIRGVLGVLLVIGIAFLFSNNKRKVNWRLVITGLGFQLFFAIFIIHGEALRRAFFPLGLPKMLIDWLGGAVIKLLVFIAEGSKFVFGALGVNPGGEGSMGFFFAFQVLPTIIFFASLTAVLYYTGILQMVVKGMAWLMARLMGTSGAESLSNTANVFIGQTEAPILIRPYIASMTRSEILTIMIGGMATVAGGVMASYIQMLGTAMAAAKNIALQAAQLQFAVHLITASVMAAPASLVISKILYPETEEPKTKGTVKVEVEKGASNVIEAAANGAADGLKLALNVGGMLIVFIAFIYLFNFLLGEAGSLLGVNEYLQAKFGHPLSMQLILGLILQYIAIGIGVPAQDALNFGSLFGTKVVLNEFVAYIGLADLIKQGAMTAKGITMATFALCGFANFSSIAIQLGGIAPMAPNRKKDIAALGLKAV